MKQTLRAFLAGTLLALTVGVLAQTYNFFPPPGLTYNSTTHQIASANLQPAGSTTQVQYNQAGTLTGNSLFAFNQSTDVLNIGASNTPGTYSVGQLDSMVVNGVSIPAPGFAINSNIQGVIENHSYVSAGPTGGSRYYGVRSRGSISAPAIVQSGDNLTSIYAAGYNGSTYSLGGQLLFQIDGTPGAAAMPTDLDMLLSPAGSQVPVSVLRLYNTGAFGVNTSQGSAGNTIVSGGAGAAANWGPVILNSPAAVTSTLGVGNGGTGLATLPVHGILLGEAAANVGSIAAMAADTLVQGQGATADPAAVAVPNCTAANNALNYATSTHTFSCATVSGGGGTPAAPTTSIQFNNAGAFGGDAGLTYVGSTTQTVTLGSATVAGTLQGSLGATTSSAGNQLAINGGSGGSVSGVGGPLHLGGGVGQAAGQLSGGATLSGANYTSAVAAVITLNGSAPSGSNLAGASMTLVGGNATGTNNNPGSISLTGGNTPATNGTGAAVNLTAGNGTGTTSTGGNIVVNAGTGTATNGFISLVSPVETGSALISIGTKFTASGCSNTTTVGGAVAGSFHSGTTGTCTVTITLPTAPNGWTCDAHDVTTPADVINQTATAVNSCTVSGSTTSGDVITFKAMGF